MRVGYFKAIQNHILVFLKVWGSTRDKWRSPYIYEKNVHILCENIHVYIHVIYVRVFVCTKREDAPPFSWTILCPWLLTTVLFPSFHPRHWLAAPVVSHAASPFQQIYFRGPQVSVLRLPLHLHLTLETTPSLFHPLYADDPQIKIPSSFLFLGTPSIYPTAYLTWGWNFHSDFSDPKLNSCFHHHAPHHTPASLSLFLMSVSGLSFHQKWD